MMMDNNTVLVFKIEDQLYCIRLSYVLKAIQSVAVKPLPKSPKIIIGVINYHGEIIPVLDTRSRFKKKPRPIIPSDQFLIINTGKRMYALPVDNVLGVHEIDALEPKKANEIDSNLGFVTHLLKYQNEIVFLVDCKKLISPRETSSLNKAMNPKGGTPQHAES